MKLDDMLQQALDKPWAEEAKRVLLTYARENGSRIDEVELDRAVGNVAVGVCGGAVREVQWSPNGRFLAVGADDGTVVGVFGMILDQTELKQAEDQLRVMAEFDALTRLANRYRLYDTIAGSAARSSQQLTSV